MREEYASFKTVFFLTAICCAFKLHVYTLVYSSLVLNYESFSGSSFELAFHSLVYVLKQI